jgi:hypothetical protein
VYLNYRNNDTATHFRFWEEHLKGAALSSIAHALSHRRTVYIASTLDIPNMGPLGSHPLIDPCYSNTELQIRHDGITLSSLDKTRLVADWDTALQHLRVCNQFIKYSPTSLNCGECEKCVRTMLSLLVIGKLDKTNAFPCKNVSAELVMAKVSLKGILVSILRPHYQELLPSLQGIGRSDLIHVIERKIAHSYHRHWDWRARLRRFDDSHLGGNLRWAKNWFNRHKGCTAESSSPD